MAWEHTGDISSFNKAQAQWERNTMTQFQIPWDRKETIEINVKLFLN